MQDKDLILIINKAWDDRAALSPETQGPVREAVAEALAGLDQGRFRVADKTIAGWRVNQWLKSAILLSFRLEDSKIISSAPERGPWWDKVPSKFKGWDATRFTEAGFRAVPNCIVRYSAYVAPKAVLMPCFINVGAYVGEGTMIDTWTTVGSCAQVGRDCHISGGVGLGGVLEPLQASPVVIEDNCFIGARSEIAEGVIVEEGAVISMGVFIGASTKIIDRATGEIFYGRVPSYAVVVPGSLPGKPLPDGEPGPSLSCAVIVKRVDARTRSRTSVNELLRD